MNRSNTHTISELTELASLDAFGLLDPQDALEFEAAFLAAPERIRDSLLHLQAELASDVALLGNEQLPEELRDKVLARVSEAMASQDERYRPLAQIGPAGRAFAEDTSRPAASFGQSIWTWRAVALVLLGVSITLAVFGIVSDRNHRELIQAINSRQGQFVLNQPLGEAIQIVWPTDNGVYQVVALVDPTGHAGRIRIYANHDGTNTRIAYDLDRRMRPLTIYAIDDLGEFGPAGAEYVVAHLDPRQFSAGVVDGFNPDWLGSTRFVARDRSGRDVLIQV